VRPVSSRLHLWFVLGLVSVVIPLALVAADIDVKTEYDRKVDFRPLRSYVWLPAPPYTSTVAPEVRAQGLDRETLDEPIRAAIDRVLAAKQFRVVRDGSQPDLHIVYYAAFGIDMNTSVLGEHYGYLTGWGSPFIGATPTTSLRIIEQGTLIVDVLRSDRTVAIWRGRASGAVDRSRTQEQRLRTIDTAVTKMFAKFPPKG
jgi:hypothetical protein